MGAPLRRARLWRESQGSIAAEYGARVTGTGAGVLAGLGVWRVAAGSLLLTVLLLHGLYKLLDAEGIDWWDTVARGARYALNLPEPASRAQFWGILAPWAWIWVMARVCLALLDLWIGAALAVPVVTPTVRRLRSMTSAQLLEGALVFLCLVALVLL